MWWLTWCGYNRLVLVLIYSLMLLNKVGVISDEACLATMVQQKESTCGKVNIEVIFSFRHKWLPIEVVDIISEDAFLYLLFCFSLWNTKLGCNFLSCVLFFFSKDAPFFLYGEKDCINVFVFEKFVVCLLDLLQVGQVFNLVPKNSHEIGLVINISNWSYDELTFVQFNFEITDHSNFDHLYSYLV